MSEVIFKIDEQISDLALEYKNREMLKLDDDYFENRLLEIKTLSLDHGFPFGFTEMTKFYKLALSIEELHQPVVTDVTDMNQLSELYNMNYYPHDEMDITE